MTDREIDALVAEKVYSADPMIWAPLYTTNPEDWEQVLDKMAADGWSWQITAVDGVFLCLFWQGGDLIDLCASEEVSEEASTKGRAICLAALSACEVDVEEAV